MNDLHSLVQKPGEMLRQYMQRFNHISYNIPDAEDPCIISTFSANVRDSKMREELSMDRVRTVSELFALADRCARAEEGRLAPEIAKKSEEQPESSGKRKRLRKREPRQALAAEPSPSAGAGKRTKTEGGSPPPSDG